MYIDKPTTIKNIVVNTGKSYGETETIFAVVRGGVDIYHSVKTFYHYYRGYNAEGWWTGNDVLYCSESFQCQAGDYLFFQVGAGYDPNISGAHTSSGSVTFTLE